VVRLVGLICAALLGVSLIAPASAQAESSRVPAGFAPASTSWISDSTGFVLGYAPCAAGQCPALARTNDGGATWRSLRAPAVPLTTVDNRARVYFANELDGLISDGQVAYATHTGGLLWRRVNLPAGEIGAVAHSNRAWYAVVANDTGTRLVSAPLQADRWTAVPGVALAGKGRGTIATRGGNVYVTLNVIFEAIGYWSTANGRTWTPGEPPCAADQSPELTAAGGAVFAVCSYNPGRGFMLKDLFRLDATGRFAFVSNAPDAGITTGAAAASESTVVIAAVGGGAAWLHRSSVETTTWDTPFVTEEPPFADLAFTGSLTGVTLWGGPLWGVATLYRTVDGGSTWANVAIQ
jgi:photosystem II stability/assembly factor-like uncharacterized protein